MVEFNKKSGVGSMLRIMMDNIEQPKCNQQNEFNIDSEIISKLHVRLVE